MSSNLILPSDTRSPIFIGGHHRSGTTLMRVMLHRHPNIACGPESELLERTSFLEFHQYFEETWLPQLRRYGFGTDEVDRAMAAFMDSFFTRYQLQRGKRRWAEKTPKNIFRIDYLFRLFPNAQFIHMIRDPRDVHCSIRAKARTTTPRWSSITPERTARGWTKRIKRGLPWRHDHAHYLVVRYENLVADPVRTMRIVLDFLGEPWAGQILQTEDGGAEATQLSNVNRPIFSTSVARWRRDLPPEDLETIESIAGSEMCELGYELSSDLQPAGAPVTPTTPDGG